MPVYDLRCRSCGHKTYDILVSKPSDLVKQKCGCGKTDWEKLPVKAAVRFKGEGWSKPQKVVEDEG